MTEPTQTTPSPIAVPWTPDRANASPTAPLQASLPHQPQAYAPSPVQANPVHPTQQAQSPTQAQPIPQPYQAHSISNNTNSRRLNIFNIRRSPMPHMHRLNRQ